MKIITIAALAASLLLAADEVKSSGAKLGKAISELVDVKIQLNDAEKAIAAAQSSALTPAHAAKWKEINETVRAAAEAAEKAELVFYRAKDARDKALADGNAALLKMQVEAKCPQCLPQAQPDGTLTWPKPVEKKEK